MNIYNPTLETVLETEEFVTAEEYMRRRARGEINPADVRYSFENKTENHFGGFIVKLRQPRYRVSFKKAAVPESNYGW